MEPRSFERGKLSFALEFLKASELQWSRVRLNAERGGWGVIRQNPGEASMEPRSFERGKALFVNTIDTGRSRFNGAAFV